VDLAAILKPRLQVAAVEIGHMATREKRLAQFDGSGDPPPAGGLRGKEGEGSRRAIAATILLPRPLRPA